MDLFRSEVKVQNEVPLPESGRILANERALQGTAQENLIGYSIVLMCFVILLNVTNGRATSHRALQENEFYLV